METKCCAQLTHGTLSHPSAHSRCSLTTQLGPGPRYNPNLNCVREPDAIFHRAPRMIYVNRPWKRNAMLSSHTIHCHNPMLILGAVSPLDSALARDTNRIQTVCVSQMPSSTELPGESMLLVVAHGKRNAMLSSHTIHCHTPMPIFGAVSPLDSALARDTIRIQTVCVSQMPSSTELPG